MDGHGGRLFVERNKHGLDAEIVIGAKRVRVMTRDAEWSWPIRDVSARRWNGKMFQVAMGNEQFLFEPHDPMRFTFEVVDELDRVDRRRPRRRPRTGRPFMRPAVTVPQRAAPTSAPAPVAQGARTRPAAEIWTDLASGRDEASLLETLASLSVAAEHKHRWERADVDGDDTIQVCADCHRVFVDLNAAEEAGRESETPR